MTKHVVTNKQIVAVYIQTNFSKTKTAEQLGMTWATLYQRIERSPELKAMITEAEEMRIDIAEETLHELINFKDFRAVKFFLETKGRKRGYGQKIEIDRGEGDRKFSTVKIVDGQKVIELN